MALTDKKAVQVALWIAIDTEESLIDAYRNDYTGKVDESEEGVKIARRRIEAFKRVLSRYYDGEMAPGPPKGKGVSVLDLMKGKHDAPA